MTISSPPFKSNVSKSQSWILHHGRWLWTKASCDVSPTCQITFLLYQKWLWSFWSTPFWSTSKIDRLPPIWDPSHSTLEVESWNTWKHFPIVHWRWVKVDIVQIYFCRWILCFDTWHKCAQNVLLPPDWALYRDTTKWPVQSFPHCYLNVLLLGHHAIFAWF
jgi:hypothetical protein